MSRSTSYAVSRIALASASVVVAVLTSTPSFAQTQAQIAQQRNACLQGAGAAQGTRLAACTAIIEAGRESSSNISLAHSVRGDLHREKSEFDLAIEEYNLAIQLDARNHAAYFGRGLIRASKGEFDSALSDYDLAIQSNSGQSAYLSARAQAYYGKRDYTKAIADLT